MTDNVEYELVARRRMIAARMGLPLNYRHLVQGDTPSEIRASVQALQAKYTPVPSPQGLDVERVTPWPTAGATGGAGTR